jgi:hypothetical protein
MNKEPNMAKVSIEDKFFSSPELKIFHYHMRNHSQWTMSMCMGFITFFWHDTQAKETYICSKSEILMYIGCCYDTSNIETGVLDALLSSGLVKWHTDDTYEIIGNEKNIDGILNTKHRNKKAAAARWECTTHATGIPQACTTHTTRMPAASPTTTTTTTTTSTTPSELTDVNDLNEKKLKRGDSDLKKSNAQAGAREAIIYDDPHFLEKKLLPTEKKSKTKKKTDITKFSEAEIAAAERWAKITESETPWLADKIDYGEYAEAIAKIKRHIKIGDDAMDYLIGFIERDQFWRRNAISPKGVFKKNTAGVYKIDNIVIAMKSTDTRFKQAAVLAQLKAEGYE